MKTFYQAENFQNEIPHRSCDRTSNCCGAPMYDDSDICPDCREHCAAVVTCPECYGKGYLEVIRKESFASQRISPFHVQFQCDNCNGEGWIEE